MTACAERRYLAVDAELNAAYVDVMNRLQDTGRLEQKTLLRDSQRAWILFRDGECEFKASGTHGGSAYPMILADCLADLTALRTAELKAYLVCQEGDLSCPTW